jgi:predicted alpha/beta-hydrolase family hydrolase
MGTAALDQAGLKNAVLEMKKLVSGKVFLGGHSYGGRQSTMLCASDPGFVEGLLLLSYPLHPPRKPDQMRTQHFPKLKTPSLFVHGTRDPFGSIEEMQEALKLIAGRHELLPIEGAGHDLLSKGKATTEDLTAKIQHHFQNFFLKADS